MRCEQQQEQRQQHLGSAEGGGGGLLSAVPCRAVPRRIVEIRSLALVTIKTSRREEEEGHEVKKASQTHFVNC